MQVIALSPEDLFTSINILLLTEHGSRASALEVTICDFKLSSQLSVRRNAYTRPLRNIEVLTHSSFKALHPLEFSLMFVAILKNAARKSILPFLGKPVHVFHATHTAQRKGIANPLMKHVFGSTRL